MSHTLADLAILAGGKVIGDSSVIIKSAKPLNEVSLGDITFVDNPKLIKTAIYSQATAFIVNENTHRKMSQPENENSSSVSFIVTDDPIGSFIKVVQHFKGSRTRINMGIHADASVDPQAQIGSQTNIYPGTFIDEGTVIGNRCTIYSGVRIGHDVHIGDDVTLYPNVVIYPEMILGNRITIHACTVIGADGFGYRFNDGRHEKMPQLGIVHLEDDVEIGACSTIDRATFGTTLIGKGTKIDNLTAIGHNCHIGKHNMFVAQTGFAGSCITGDYVVTAGQAGIRDHVTIGTRSRVGAHAGVAGDVPEDSDIIGSPATAAMTQKRIVMSLKQLPEMRRTVNRMQKRLDQLDA